VPRLSVPVGAEEKQGGFPVKPGMNKCRFAEALVDGAGGLLTGKGHDDPFDLAPMAEAQDILVLAALLCPQGSLGTRIVAKAANKVGRVVECRSAGDEDGLHGGALSCSTLPRRSRGSVNSAFTIVIWPALANQAAVWQGTAMTKREPQAGGFWLVLAIIVGATIGIWQGQPSIGILAGTAIGALIAVAVYLRDRARS
jgi:hypothetical protein